MRVTGSRSSKPLALTQGLEGLRLSRRYGACVGVVGAVFSVCDVDLPSALQELYVSVALYA